MARAGEIGGSGADEGGLERGRGGAGGETSAGRRSTMRTSGTYPVPAGKLEGRVPYPPRRRGRCDGRKRRESLLSPICGISPLKVRVQSWCHGATGAMWVLWVTL